MSEKFDRDILGMFFFLGTSLASLDSIRSFASCKFEEPDIQTRAINAHVLFIYFRAKSSMTITKGQIE